MQGKINILNNSKYVKVIEIIATSCHCNGVFIFSGKLSKYFVPNRTLYEVNPLIRVVLLFYTNPDFCFKFRIAGNKVVFQIVYMPHQNEN